MMSLRASTGQGSSTQQPSRQGVLSPAVGAQPSFCSSHTLLPPPSTCLAPCPLLAHFSAVSRTAGIQRPRHLSSLKETTPSSLTPPWVDKTQAQPALESASRGGVHFSAEPLVCDQAQSSSPLGEVIGKLSPWDHYAVWSLTRSCSLCSLAIASVY